GRRFNLEMQRQVLWFFSKRVLYYWADLYSSQLLEGAYHATLQPTYSICFTDSSLFDDTDYHHCFRVADLEHGSTLCPDLEIHVLELKQFAVAAEAITTPLERWCYFLKHGEELDNERLPVALDTPVIRQALEVLTMLSQNEIERQRYLSRRKAER